MVSPPGGHRLKWQKPSPTGGPSAAQLLLQWFEADYSAYTRSPNKEKFLEGLRKTIKDAGHEGCTLRSVRSKVESLERQMKGEQTPSRVLKENLELFGRVFSGVNAKTAAGSGAAAAERDSDEEDEAETVNSTLEGSDCSSEDEFADSSAMAKSRSSEAPAAKRKEEGRRQGIPAHDREIQVKKRVKRAEVGYRGKHEDPDSDENGDEDQDEELAKSAPTSKAQCRQVPPIHIPSKEEIERIGTLLRERHQLKEVGVSQAEIDRYLPLPDARGCSDGGPW
jgi:hypothetical protein